MLCALHQLRLRADSQPPRVDYWECLFRYLAIVTEAVDNIYILPHNLFKKLLFCGNFIILKPHVFIQVKVLGGQSMSGRV